MRLIRFRSLAQGGPRLGVLEEGHTDAPGSGGTTGGIGPVTALAGGPALSDLLALPLSDIREVCEKPSGERFSPEEIELLAPGSPTSVPGRPASWKAGSRPTSTTAFTRRNVPSCSSSRRPGGSAARAAPCRSVPIPASTFPNPSWPWC